MLLHYRQSWLFEGDSLIQSEDFFLTPNDPLSPVDEKHQTHQAFLDPHFVTKRYGEPMPAACKYPLRFIFLNEERLKKGLPPYPSVACPSYEEFKRKLQFDRAWLVFSSYYLNSPSSAYGHTLLRLERTLADSSKNQLLDIGINYAAVVPDVGPFEYAYRGLFGGFHGQFSLMPYYVKIREYNDYEARDLWSYRIKMTPLEKERLRAYLWELGGGVFPYYFLSENCSYHILYALQMAFAEPLLAQLPFWVIPSDTIKALAAHDRIDQTEVRPSIYQIQKHRRSSLHEEETEILESILAANSLSNFLEGWPPERQMAVLDAGIDVLELQNPIEGEDPKRDQLRRDLLLARAEIPLRSKPLTNLVDKKEDPVLGHDSARSGFGFLTELNGTNSLLLEHRFAYHDLLDPPLGFPKHSVVEFGRIVGTVQGDRVALQELSFVESLVLSPYDPLGENRSWGVGLGLRDMSDSYCGHCLALEATGQWGLAKEARFAGRTFGMLAILMQGRVSGSPGYERSKVAVDFEPKSIFLSEIHPDHRMLLQSSYLHAPESKRHQNLLLEYRWRWRLARGFAIEFFALLETGLANQWGSQLYWYY